MPISVTADQEHEARRLVEVRARAIWAGYFIEVTPATTVAQLGQIWLASPSVQRNQQSTIEAYEANVRTILSPRIGAVPVKSLTPGFLNRFIQQLALEKSSSYASKARKTLSQMLNVAVQQGVFEHNPVSTVARIRHEERDFLSLEVDQVPLALALMSQWKGKNPDRRGGVRPNTTLLIDTALITLGSSSRPGEALAIRRSDVRFTARGRLQLRIGGTVSHTTKHGNVRKDSPKKARQRRWITVPTFTAAVLRRRLAEYVDNDDELLFATKNGTPYAVNHLELLYRRFREANDVELRAIGIDNVHLFTPKVFRKTAASIVEDDANIDLARRFLGHADERTTRNHYLPPEDTVPEVTAEILARAFADIGDVDDLRCM
ncbi:site-specific integrase [Microbacterium sp. NPDC096154]|uniref:tyrosine-type recombinase/integrase n=1 Tax=Microbacterium sp. NPDC096154 TaxID=3155549 RepID=UPI00331986B3